ncbi:MAG: hypothetical protein K2W97_05295 [Chthoniobacterales bacterium]|nr:hypothetical protein [Chthoniobacterales bacterium]
MLPFQKLFCSLFLGWHVIAAPSKNTILRYLELEEYNIFLNKVATSDDHSRYDEKMSTMPVSLLRMGSPGTYSYLILPNASRDLLYVGLRSVELYLDTTWNLPKNISLVCPEQSNNPSIAENIDKALKSNKLALFIDDRSQ